MAKPQPIALIAEGQLSRSFLSRLPHLRERLGPVKAASPRVASRIVNTLRAGRPAPDYASLAACRAVLIYVPGPRLREIQEQMLAAAPWRNKVALLCDEVLSSTTLAPLAQAGSFVASLAPIEGFEERRFVAEGDPQGVRLARLLVEDGRRRVIEIAPGGKDLFLAGLDFATSLFTPMAAAATECLKGTGLPTGAASSIVERLFDRSLRGYVKAGRKSWGGPLALKDQEQVRRHLEALFRASPLLASYYTESALFALRLFREETGWLPLGQAAATA